MRLVEPALRQVGPLQHRPGEAGPAEQTAAEVDPGGGNAVERHAVADLRQQRVGRQRAPGQRGAAKNCFRVAIEKVEKALRYAYRDRRTKKRDF
ncbi:MAG: 50S ribosomal protein L20, partial [Planctomycetia bacterium]|nr:50S ribosomal protein L20 [Planctomycetia bacterium]